MKRGKGRQREGGNREHEHDIQRDIMCAVCEDKVTVAWATNKKNLEAACVKR